jgi:succinyl-diaminopimelate desuccinylase
VSGNEAALADLVESRLRTAEHLHVDRVGDNVVARTEFGCLRRVIVAGHLDTVPGEASEATIAGDRLIGLGACDMKGSLSVMLSQAQVATERALDVTWIFYSCEEVTRSRSGLLELARERPEFLAADVALLAEPTGGRVEAGCQGSMRVGVVLGGRRAHTARPFAGRNAIHRLGALVDAIAHYEPRIVTIDEMEYVEQLQVVSISGGVAANVVPDEARATLNHRVAPDRDLEQAASALRALCGPFLEEGDTWEVEDWGPPARPSLDNDLIKELVAATGKPAKGKMGWTDVAFFAERGVPATNFGAGDPLLAHRSDEFVTAGELASFDAALRQFLR